ncbi:MAG TPA: NADH-quinone oxidoreductase subunit H [Peptococcaceae bacterium]|nr:MAG: Ech hydrogenase putative subunit B [Clostridia bacterium 41_269]HBT20399.1 NADH-quinone oxidoreductase subunit H [Peptococcaceae bacterium]
MTAELVQILLFPGFVFLFAYAMFVEWFDRKAYALMQNRVGPPWFQPFADFIKLMAKEYIIPKRANPVFFLALPTGILAFVLTTIVCIPVASNKAMYSFEGDILVVAFLLTAASMVIFLMGWFSNNPFTIVGGTRAISQMISYEVPLLFALLTPAIMAGSWSIAEITAFFRANPILLIFQIPALIIALIALQAKLERVPFDIPEAETEIVGGPLAELSGRGLALFHLATDIEMIVGVTLLANLFLGGFSSNIAIGLIEFFVKTLALVFILTAMRTVMARVRIEQLVLFCWHRLVPAALVQVLIAVLIKGWWLT